MSLTLSDALTNLTLPTPTIPLLDGVVAQLSRYEYINPYLNQVNYPLYVPLLYFNIINGQISIGNTAEVNFINTDLFVADDWTVLNQQTYPFTATLTQGSATITNVTTPSVALANGQYITGNGIPIDTTIVSGSAGTYVLSNEVTISGYYQSLTMTLT